MCPWHAWQDVCLARLTRYMSDMHDRMHLLPLVDTLRTAAGLPDMLSAQPPGRCLPDRLSCRLTGCLSDTYSSSRTTPLQSQVVPSATSAATSSITPSTSSAAQSATRIPIRAVRDSRVGSRSHVPLRLLMPSASVSAAQSATAWLPDTDSEPSQRLTGRLTSRLTAATGQPLISIVARPTLRHHLNGSDMASAVPFQTSLHADTSRTTNDSGQAPRPQLTSARTVNTALTSPMHVAGYAGHHVGDRMGSNVSDSEAVLEQGSPQASGALSDASRLASDALEGGMACGTLHHDLAETPGAEDHARQANAPANDRQSSGIPPFQVIIFG